MSLLREGENEDKVSVQRGSFTGSPLWPHLGFRGRSGMHAAGAAGAAGAGVSSCGRWRVIAGSGRDGDIRV